MSNNVEEGSKLKIGHWDSKIDRRCEDCNMDFFDIKEFEYHMARCEHAKYYCVVCDVYSNCQKNYDLHLIGRKHLNGKKPKEKEMKNFRKANPNLFKYYCEVCDVYAHCQKSYDLHLNGRKHKEKQIKIQKYDEYKNVYKFHCEICDVYALAQKNYDMHLAGQKHQKKVIEIVNWRKGP